MIDGFARAMRKFLGILIELFQFFRRKAQLSDKLYHGESPKRTYILKPPLQIKFVAVNSCQLLFVQHLFCNIIAINIDEYHLGEFINFSLTDSNCFKKQTAKKHSPIYYHLTPLVPFIKSAHFFLRTATIR